MINGDSKLHLNQKLLLLNIPNTPDESTPIGKSEDDNIVVEYFGKPCPAGDFREPRLAKKIAFQKHSLVVVKAAVFFSLLLC